MKEREIRNTEVLDRYLELVAEDVKRFFDFNSFVEIACPACSSGKYRREFDKNGFQYVGCADCGTLFVNPRPGFEVLKKFYSDSPSTAFWVDKFFKPVAEARREKIFRPRAEYASGITGKGGHLTVGDIGAGFGLFLEEWRKIDAGNDYIAIEPSLEMAETCKSKDIEVRCACLEELDEKKDRFDVLTAFELAEHLFDPEGFIRKIHSLLKPKGYLIMTTLNGRGFDILNLWEKSRSVTPPHHLNFFNTSSIKTLLERSGFTIDEVSTPGKLDWDIVENAKRNDGVDIGRFWGLLADEGTPSAKAELQDWLSKNNLSSHMRVVAHKR